MFTFANQPFRLLIFVSIIIQAVTEPATIIGGIIGGGVIGISAMSGKRQHCFCTKQKIRGKGNLK